MQTSSGPGTPMNQSPNQRMQKTPGGAPTNWFLQQQQQQQQTSQQAGQQQQGMVQSSDATQVNYYLDIKYFDKKFNEIFLEFKIECYTSANAKHATKVGSATTWIKSTGIFNFFFTINLFLILFFFSH